MRRSRHRQILRTQSGRASDKLDAVLLIDVVDHPLPVIPHLHVRLPPLAYRPFLIAVASITFLLTLTGCRNANETATGELTACRLKGIEREVRCGSLRMPENPDLPQGRAIDIHFAVVPAIARNKESDPVFVLAGGPGQAATRVAGSVMPLFGRLNARRDIVFVDQRGTGSSNALDCPIDEGTLAESVEPTRQVERLRACLKSLASDLAQYPTWIAVRDLEAVRARLGAPRLNLWGASYGTRVALDYLRQFPERVRTVVLDGVAPPDMALPASFAIDAAAALDRLIEACRNEPGCNARHPELSTRIDALLERAESGFDATVRHPLTGAQETLRIDRTLLAALLRTPLYVPQLSAVLPFALAEASRGDFDALFALTLALSGSVSENFAYGMHLAVICAEDQPRVTPAARNQARASRLGPYFIDLYSEVCESVASRPVPEAFRSVVPSTVPVLILSGGMDPATPPRHGAAIAERLGNARHLIAPTLGHGISGQACAPELITRFIRSASFDRIDGECLQQLPAARFFVPVEAAAKPSAGALR